MREALTLDPADFVTAASRHRRLGTFLPMPDLVNLYAWPSCSLALALSQRWRRESGPATSLFPGRVTRNAAKRWPH